MNATLAIRIFAVGISLLMAADANAQGKAGGRGLGHAASRASGMSGAGLSTAAQAASNSSTPSGSMPVTVSRQNNVAPRDVGREFGRASGVAAGVGRSSNPLPGNVSERSGHGMARTVAHPTGQSVPPTNSPPTNSGNWEQIQQQRLKQAEHLRAIADRNGNEALLTTANRMEASANANYHRQSSSAHPVSNPAGAPDSVVVAPETQTATPATAPASLKQKSSTAAKRGFWFRSR
ncbi:MAG: hypothetical protein ABL921_01610 [Pirellula sp.]